ncbi:MAG TPA: MDR family oxidoreductase [Thermoanaerobaculia bacterium]|jgi:acrylyl-CoA reductase (NADPH)|nr:MDR family oxidoreductase [Thermoanaerobaculia bacterium]
MRALVAHSQNDVRLDDDVELPAEGDVVIDVAYSSLNYKDALAVTGRGRIVRRFPMVLGIDLAGTVVSSSSAEFAPGDRVVGIAHGLGELDGGGYAQQQRVKADAIVPLPAGLDPEQSMAIGTAGFTAMLCVLALEQAGVAPSDREVVVTGAAGGVGSLAVMLLARRGYRVAASTGRPELEPYLRGLGATSIVPRDELAKKGGPMQSERWAGAVDTVGGETLANLIAQTVYEGAVAACGMAGGHELHTAVWPFILRNVSLLGVSSLLTPKPKRLAAWSRLATDVDFDKLRELRRIEPLSNIRALSEEILAGQTKGRVVIDVAR